MKGKHLGLQYLFKNINKIMSKTNSLTSHNPERNSHRVDKMSGMGKKRRRDFSNRNRSHTMKSLKKMASRKRRQYLKIYSNDSD